MRRDGVIIQQASGEYQSLLRIGLHRHLTYAERNGFDYWPLFGETRPKVAQDIRHAYWEKPYLIREALYAGYEFVVYLDSDALIIGEEDLREALPLPVEGFGSVWHAQEDWGDERSYDHFNIGVLYVRSSPLVQDFMQEWIDQGDSEHPWHDQHAFYQVCQRGKYDGLLTPLSRRWHSCPPHFAANAEDTQVLAWHGGGSVEARKVAMEDFIRGRGSAWD